MKEFIVYTLLRLGLFVGAFALVFGVWDLVADAVPVVAVLVIAFILSGAASLFVLNRPREAFARRVEARAAKASAKFEELRSKEDDA